MFYVNQRWKYLLQIVQIAPSWSWIHNKIFRTSWMTVSAIIFIMNESLNYAVYCYFLPIDILGDRIERTEKTDRKQQTHVCQWRAIHLKLGGQHLHEHPVLELSKQNIANRVVLFCSFTWSCFGAGITREISATLVGRNYNSPQSKWSRKR